MKTALVVMVHGSPRSESNDDVYRILEVVRARGSFDLVEAGFMECNQPDIPAAIVSCIEKGATRIIAVPYFLHTGKHVMTDLPEILNHAAIKYRNVEFLLAGFVGDSAQVTDILAEKADKALN